MDEYGSIGRRSALTRRVGDPPAGPAAAEGGGTADERYEIQARIGEGGMGEVLVVRDRDLRRQIAMKVLKEDLAGSEAHRRKFIAEAQATSQLEHPGIPPVHDIGVTPEGSVYFTMKLVRGLTLREILRDLVIGSRAARREHTLHRLLTVLERVCEAVHFSHEKGVVHRDLKPENLMIGEYGEVHVMDWGIASVRTTVDDDAYGEDRVEIDATGPGTAAGTIKGTLPYMSPEQARGDGASVDRRSDVFALGCILYEILTLHSAYEGDGPDLLRRVREGAFPDVAGRNPRRPVPAVLADLCRRAMAGDPAARPASAREFGSSLRSWLDGSAEGKRRHEEAEELAARGREAAARYRSLLRDLSAAESGAAVAAGRFQPWQSVEESAPAIDARERVRALMDDVAAAFAETTRWLEAAIVAEPGNGAARAALADVWAGRLAEAEAAGNRQDVTHALRMVGRYDDGRLAGLVAGTGSLVLRSDPPGAEVLLRPFEERRGILVAGEERSLGRTPLGPVELPMGTYLCLLRREGFPEVLYPVHVTRNRAWEGTVRLRTAAEIGDGFVLVPGGPFLFGEGKVAGLRELPDFAVAIRPVTFGDWGEFLAAVEEERGADAARALVPGNAGTGLLMERDPGGAWMPVASLVEGPARERCLREHGAGFEARLPVGSISYGDAEAWCAWKSRATGAEWRLPSEEEREKAARGVDGRRFPWGDLEHASLAKCNASRDERSQPEPVGSFPMAASIYGMADAAGNSWEWTSSWYDLARSLRVLRGGSYSSTAFNLRCAGRLWAAPDSRYGGVGFRCVRGFA